jgi:hypothetical protein
MYKSLTRLTASGVSSPTFNAFVNDASADFDAQAEFLEPSQVS